MKRYLLSRAIAGLFSLLIGCNGFDTTQLLIHPDTAVASETFDVVLANVYLYLDTGSTVSKNVERDSLHLCVGLPESWGVAGAHMVVVDDIGTEQMLALQSGTMDAQSLLRLAQQYLTKTVELSPDAGLPAALRGKTVTAHGRTSDEEVTVNVDDVKQWKGFSAPVNIVFEKGSKPDTVIPIDSAIAFASGSGFSDDSLITMIAELKADPLLGGLIPDTVGICVVPIAVFLQIKAGGKEGGETIYYFSKTGSMQPQPSSGGSLPGMLLPDMGDMDAGDMTCAPITVVSGAWVTNSRPLFDASAVRAVTDRSTGTVRIDLGSMNPKLASIGIYSLQGNLLRTLAPAGFTNSVVWNGTDKQGIRVGSGSYLIRIAGNGNSVVRSVRLVR